MVRKHIAFKEIEIESPDENVEICKLIITNTMPQILYYGVLQSQGCHPSRGLGFHCVAVLRGVPMFVNR